MFSPFATKYGGLYQELLKGVASYQHLGGRLVRLAEQAHAFRQFDKVEELGQILCNLPIKHYQAIGYYFLAIAANHNGNGDQQKARKLLEVAADNAPDQYKGKAILSLAAVSANTRDYESEMYFYSETIKAGTINVASVEALRGIAIFKAREGYHGHAVRDLEKLLPLIKYAPPHIYFDYLNSYAVELSETGRLGEAKDAALAVVSSPLSRYYPEWKETLLEIDRKLYKSRSSVTVSSPNPQPEVEQPQPISNVIAFPKKEAPADDLIAELSKFESVTLTPLQLLGLILKVVLKERITSAEVDRICNAYYQLIREYYAE